VKDPFVSKDQAMILEQLRSKVEEHDVTLNRHDVDIQKLRLTSQNLEKRQLELRESMGELSREFGGVVREVSELSRKLSDAKTELLQTMIKMTDKLSSLDQGFKSFKRSQGALCEERHKGIERRLLKAEDTDEKVREEMGSMSDTNQNAAIETLQRKIEELHRKEAESKRREEEAEARREQRKFELDNQKKTQRFSLKVAIISSLLAGTGGTVLIQWLLK
jgi:chromosome segregation ATPase